MRFLSILTWFAYLSRLEVRLSTLEDELWTPGDSLWILGDELWVPDEWG